jgi:hypothetical protein
MLRRVSRWAVLLLALPGAARAADPVGEYAVLLAKSVKDDGIDYAELARGRAALDAFVRSLETADPGATAEDRIAFWINAFNALALRQELDDAPAGRSWRVAGRDVTLDGIAEILAELKEPLVHFALHRPERSSPALSAAPYEGKSLREALAQQTAGYLGDAKQNVFDYAQLRAQLSMLLMHHREELERGRKGAVPPLQLFLADHLPRVTDPATGQPGDGAVARSLRRTTWSIAFRPWDSARDDAGDLRRGTHPAWIVLYATAVGALLILGFRALLARRP